MPAHTKGREGCRAASMGSWVRHLLATLCVALSLTLFARGDADPAGGFYLRTLSNSRPMSIMGPVLDTIFASLAVVGTSCEELGETCKHGFTVPFYCTYKGPLLCLIGCNTTGL
jgi:hypothetical protein